MIARERTLTHPLTILLTVLLTLLVVIGAGGCYQGGPGSKTFRPPPEDLMPRRVMVAKHSEIDLDANGYIDGVLVSVYFFNYDRPDPGSKQPFQRQGTLRFRLFGDGGEVLCGGEFDAQTMERSEDGRDFGPGYALQINFGTRGYADVRDRLGARLDFEFTPTANPEKQSFGSTQVRLGPVY